MAHFVFKRGSTFLLTCNFAADNNSPFALDNAAVFAELRNSCGGLIAALTAQQVEGQAGTITLSHSGDTSTWPLGLLNCDIRLENNGIISYSQTFFIAVVERMTQEAPAPEPMQKSISDGGPVHGI